MDKFSFLNTLSAKDIEEKYDVLLKDPDSLPDGWRTFFMGFDFAQKNYPTKGDSSNFNNKEFNVISLIEDYRNRGHLFTKTNPVRTRRTYSPSLDIENYGLEKSDLETTFQAGEQLGIGPASLKSIILHLQQTYCESIGIEYVHLRTPNEVSWLKTKIELKNRKQYSLEEKKQILKKLNQALAFEEFLHKKFVGQKRFSLEGNESLIPALDVIVEKGAELGIKEFIVGMSHRGRLNVLANIFNKTYENIFTEFEGKEYEDNLFDGDVKYHLGYSCDITTNNKKNVHLTLAPNPSHLEAVAPVVQGITRSKIDTYLNEEDKIVPIIIHGDAAISGQGIVYEVTQMSQLDGYKVGGTIHIVVNNQIGFTTNYLDGRSSIYCTDVAKVTNAPVFHVNTDDVEAVAQVMQIAIEYRQKFKKDVFIDILGYRKYGHNEGDEPRFTQPILYKSISQHPNARDIYLNKLISENIITKEEGEKLYKEFNTELQERLTESKEIEKATVTEFLKSTWERLKYSTDITDFEVAPKTSVSEKTLMSLSKKIFTLPKDKTFIRKVARLFDDRLKTATSTKVLDWALAENLAYASLINDGVPIRMSGQDVERGTFSHRHAVVKVQDSEEEVTLLKTIAKNQPNFYIYNSLLSEYAVLGFEYGYSIATPNGLTIWEAQFGDFNNGAQIVFDQFLSAAEEKWKLQSGLVILLPHGYEGQGAEHSSARVERFLQLCAENNLIVANCSTPANFFHILRRQLQWKDRKPLIIFTPKSLLRHPKCVSPIEEFSKENFRTIIDENNTPNKTKKLVLCTGKFYFDLLKEKETRKDDSVTLVRIEQLYPFPKKGINEIIKKYNAKELIWAQEEPLNMGAWSFIDKYMRSQAIKVLSLAESGAPATGSSKTHLIRHTAIINKVFE